MAKYACTMEASAGNPLPVGDVSMTTTLPRRMKFYDILIGSNGTPADTGFEWIVQRCTASTGGTGVTPTPLDPADGACIADARQGTYTIDPTLTAGSELLDFALNLRATFRWVAAPGGELVVPATDNAGLCFMVQHGTASDNMKVTTHFEEQ